MVMIIDCVVCDSVMRYFNPFDHSVGRVSIIYSRGLYTEAVAWQER
jgi:hypothetical protein